MCAKDRHNRDESKNEKERKTRRTTRRKRRRLPGGRGAVKGCDSCLKATYEPLRFNVQIERSRELLRASRRRTSSTLSTPQGRCTAPQSDLGVVCIFETPRIIAIDILLQRLHAFKLYFSDQLSSAPLLCVFDLYRE